MEEFSLVEQDEQDMDEKVIQTCKKGRSVEDKVGRIKYQTVLLKEVKVQNRRILDELRWIRHRLKVLGESDIDVPMLEKYAVKDQVDLEIMQCVRRAGAPGFFPKDVAKDPALVKYGLKYYDVSRRIVRMNKRLHFETGECLFEKRGHRWALTKFAFDVYGDTELDLELEKALEISSISRELEEDVRGDGRSNSVSEEEKA
jgi:hypothetical protein